MYAFYIYILDNSGVIRIFFEMYLQQKHFFVMYHFASLNISE